ncbi:hypothetical protein [Phaffia rhodozyma]|uniref:Uncharacterized protein n=1 Tax=Phaffia rhodozyma TaxID=264483 RepID=A0A0F7SV98_PHARH|nr:hypothetical protein [Phaffia rhodozyma]
MQPSDHTIDIPSSVSHRSFETAREGDRVQSRRYLNISRLAGRATPLESAARQDVQSSSKKTIKRIKHNTEQTRFSFDTTPVKFHSERESFAPSLTSKQTHQSTNNFITPGTRTSINRSPLGLAKELSIKNRSFASGRSFKNVVKEDGEDAVVSSGSEGETIRDGEDGASDGEDGEWGEEESTMMFVETVKKGKDLVEVEESESDNNLLSQLLNADVIEDDKITANLVDLTSPTERFVKDLWARQDRHTNSYIQNHQAITRANEGLHRDLSAQNDELMRTYITFKSQQELLVARVESAHQACERRKLEIIKTEENFRQETKEIFERLREEMNISIASFTSRAELTSSEKEANKEVNKMLKAIIGK